jgi:hypothetical protein
VEQLRRLWLELGALEELLRSPTVANPPALMRGDEYFLPEIRNAIAQLANRPTKPADVPMELMITTTLLNAWPRGIADSFGTIIHDADHRGLFTFQRGIAQRSDDGAAARDDFAAADIDRRLALAARSTASFPIAFEASYIPIDDSTAKPARPDMKSHCNRRTGPPSPAGQRQRRRRSSLRSVWVPACAAMPPGSYARRPRTAATTMAIALGR